jgi:hypothetical protein
MAPHRRSRLIASRRKAEDYDGEEDGSVCGDLDDDSLSEASTASHLDEDGDGDAEGSDASDCDPDEQRKANGYGHRRKPVDKAASQQAGDAPTSPRKAVFDIRGSETEAMLNGMKLADESAGLEEVNFDDIKDALDSAAAGTSATAPTPQTDSSKSQRREPAAERRRREPEPQPKDKDANPAFVPTRGGFFLHDKRSNASPSNGHRPLNNNHNHKPKTKPFGMIVDSNVPPRFVSFSYAPRLSTLSEGLFR